MELRGVGHAVEQLVSLSLHTVLGSLHIVSLRGLVVALGELIAHMMMEGFKKYFSRQGGSCYMHFLTYLWKSCNTYFYLILLVTSES